jgi:hypothetical protein
LSGVPAMAEAEAEVAFEADVDVDCVRRCRLDGRDRGACSGVGSRCVGTGSPGARFSPVFARRAPPSVHLSFLL